MSKFLKLLQQVDLFAKLASADLDKVLINHKTAINAELTGGIKSINNLFVTDKAAANSNGLQQLDEVFGRLGGKVNQMTVQNAKSSVESMLTDVGGVSFYTSPQNTGTGYEPITHTGGATSPAAYLNRIHTHLKNLNSYIDSVQNTSTIFNVA